MAKIYGGRWRLLDKPPLGQGGQATVFLVSDETGVYQEDLALKRVQNPKRHDRFVREIEAIKRLTDPKTQEAHPNIISVIDHSALDDIENPDKQFLVMPIAQGGDLSRPGRLSLYRGPRIIAVAGNRGHLWGEQHRIETRTKRNHSRVNSGRLTIGGNYSRSPIKIRLTVSCRSQSRLRLH